MIEFIKDEIYVTYQKKSHGIFCKDNIKIKLGLPNPICKPDCAWWGSPVNASFGWKEWCECECFMLEEIDWDNPIKWRLTSNSKILRIAIDDVADSQNSPLSKYVTEDLLYKKLGFSSLNLFGVYLDFNLILNDDIIAVELLDANIGHKFINPIETMFNSWDCESIVVLDKTKIEFL